MARADFPAPEAFGRRIMVCGPSNSGKSTLAVALGKRLGLTPIHLDLMRHLPRTDWVQRPDADFQRLHDEAIAGDDWVMEGNYSSLMPQRLQRATGIILISDNRWANLRRYVWRTLMQPDRVGMLEGGQDTLKWDMVPWIVVNSPRALRRYRVELPASGLPFLDIASMRRLRVLYAAWGLRR